MRALPAELRRTLERSVLEGRRAAEVGARAALGSLGVEAREKPSHLSDEQARSRRGLRAKQRQLGGGFELLVWECAYEQWHRLLFARYLAENGLLRHPVYEAPVTLAECEELAEELGEPDGWSVAARFASEILPGIFRLDDPTVQIRLAAEHRVALEQIVAGLPGEVLLADDSLGWVYQYWQSERKDQVNASEVKVGGADLSPVTQLFTENYMVRFLLENSLGAWWAARHPGSPLVKEFEYLRFDEDGRPAAGTFDGWPDTVAEVTVMDPCCGSGHFLVEAFGMLWRMRAEEEGLDSVQAQDAVLRDNLFGLELDPRCVQIAMFAVALTAWKQGGGWRLLPTPNIACSGIPAKAPLEEWTALAGGDARLERALERLHALFKDADTLGSLIEPRRAAEMANAVGLQTSVWDVYFDEIAPLLEKAAASETPDSATAVLGADAAGIARAATLLSRNYTLIATNVPYLTGAKQASPLSRHLATGLTFPTTDLFAGFLVRSLDLAATVAWVSPQKWWFLATYESFRRHLLRDYAWHAAANLGVRAFSTPMWDFTVGLTVISRQAVNSHRRHFAVVDAGDASSWAMKGQYLREGECVTLKQDALLGARQASISTVSGAGEDSVDRHFRLYEGTKPGQTTRVTRWFWELPGFTGFWVASASSPSPGGNHYSGLSRAMPRHDVLVADIPEANRSGQDALGRKGVLIAKIGELHGSLFVGSMFDNNTYVLTPRNEFTAEADRGALWAFVQSGEFRRLARMLNQKLDISLGAVGQVPFDVERWRRVVEEEFPEGLPEPWSDDPTQWLFEGRPEVATEPLQVGVGRLVGYRWPEQPEDDGLAGHADADGIVCLPAVRGESPAADRVGSLLADAYGDEWSPGFIPGLLEQAGSKKKTLAEWLRDDFFKHHCKVFSNRPFVWHLWDGRKDGFGALVNYHRLDRAGLEKLTYTYLGDWIERQRADGVDGVAGADLRLAAALDLQGKLEAILEGEPPFDIYVRWKSLAEQPIGWDPDLDDGVRLNIRPFVEAGVLRSKVNVHWKRDRGRNPDGSERHNDLHHTNTEKRQARQEAGTS
jgi:hypothetical protein